MVVVVAAHDNKINYSTLLYVCGEPRVIEVLPLIAIVRMPAVSRIMSEVREDRVVRDGEQRIDSATAGTERVYYLGIHY